MVALIILIAVVYLTNILVIVQGFLLSLFLDFWLLFL